MGQPQLIQPTPDRDDIVRLENAMRAIEDREEPDCPVTHHFAPGLYAREIFLPKDAIVVGKIHKHSHINTISKGRVQVSTEFGSEELVAPTTFVSEPGTKRAVVALEDTIWTTYHPTEETDLEKIEDEVIAPSYEALELFREEQNLLENKE